jgi:hypothetical protein
VEQLQVRAPKIHVVGPVSLMRIQGPEMEDYHSN